MLNKILNYFGLYRVKSMSEYDILSLISNRIIFFESEFDKEEEKKLFNELVKVDGFTDYLRSTLKKDQHRFFVSVTPQEQLMTKGAYSRTLYFLGLAQKKNEITKESNKIKTISRYAR